tara:strand:- start:65 stop:1213 length:1149 start_codon:yes stop_codon:yes gene_type:complete
MSQINVRNLSNENDDGAPNLVGIATFSSVNYFVPPSGTTEERPTNPQPGDLRFNTDNRSLEYYRGDTIGWFTIEKTSPNLDGGTRAVIAYGYIHPASSSEVDYFNIGVKSNYTNFGNMNRSTKQFGCASSRTRIIWAGGANGNGPAETNAISYGTIASEGIGMGDFGDMVTTCRSWGGMSNNTRAAFCGGYTEPSSPYYTNKIEYVQLGSLGDAFDFGDASVGKRVSASFGSSTRGIIANQYGPYINTIDYITLSSTGNAVDFGDYTEKVDFPTGCSNSIRGLRAGGAANGDVNKDTIEYITIATTGDAIDFGNLLVARTRFSGASSSSTRACFIGGNAPTTDNVIQYVEIAHTGHAMDFADMQMNAQFGAAGPNTSGHGGL